MISSFKKILNTNQEIFQIPPKLYVLKLFLLYFYISFYYQFLNYQQYFLFDQWNFHLVFTILFFLQLYFLIYFLCNLNSELQIMFFGVIVFIHYFQYFFLFKFNFLNQFQCFLIINFPFNIYIWVKFFILG